MLRMLGTSSPNCHRSHVWFSQRMTTFFLTTWMRMGSRLNPAGNFCSWIIDPHLLWLYFVWSHQGEPYFFRYVPILPMVLVNGSEGIGTGWSTYIPNYNPRDIVANLRRLLNDESTVPMHPWYRGFKVSNTNWSGSSAALRCSSVKKKLMVALKHIFFPHINRVLLWSHIMQR